MGHTIVTGSGIELVRLQALKGALKLEMHGLKHSSGSIYARVKKEFGFKGNKAKVLAQLEQHIEKREKELGFSREQG